MSIRRIYAIPTADVTTLPYASVHMKDNSTDSAYLVTESGFTEWDAFGTAYLVGEWDNITSEPLSAITTDYADWIRPLGNEDGRATGILDSLRWQGDAEAKNLVAGSRYAPDNAPFTLEIERQDYGSTALPWDNTATYQTGDFVTSGGMWRSLQDNNTGNTPFGGSPFWEFINQSGFWGWVVKMISEDPARDITARGIGVYTDPECTVFQYTTGSFINDGKYGDVFYTECPPGNRLANPDQVNFALLLGAAQEGFLNMPDDSAEALFWSADQP